MAKLLISANCKRDLCGNCRNRSGLICDVFNVSLDVRRVRGKYGGYRFVRTARCVKAEQKVRMLELLVSGDRSSFD